MNFACKESWRRVRYTTSTPALSLMYPSVADAFPRERFPRCDLPDCFPGSRVGGGPPVSCPSPCAPVHCFPVQTHQLLPSSACGNTHSRVVCIHQLTALLPVLVRGEGQVWIRVPLDFCSHVPVAVTFPSECTIPLCRCVYVCVCVKGHVFVSVHMPVRVPEDSSGCCPSGTVQFLFVETKFLTGLQLAKYTNTHTQKKPHTYTHKHECTHVQTQKHRNAHIKYMHICVQT